MDLRAQTADEYLAGISLCSGYAGLDLGISIAEPGYRTVCYVEREAHAAATLVARMADAALDPAPIWDDLRSFDGGPWRGRVSVLSAGYPCQPFSLAGKRRGEQDPRHLWPEVARVISESDPEWVFLENVEGHLSLGCSDVARDLRELGYRPKAGLFTAREAGARHQRKRLFILAHAHGERRRLLPRHGDRSREDIADGAVRHQEGQWRAVCAERYGAQLDGTLADVEGGWVDGGDGMLPLFAPGPGELQEWDRILRLEPRAQPALLRTDNGVAGRVERSRAAGNGVCSLAAALAWRTLRSAHAR